MIWNGDCRVIRRHGRHHDKQVLRDKDIRDLINTQFSAKIGKRSSCCCKQRTKAGRIIIHIPLLIGPQYQIKDYERRMNQPTRYSTIVYLVTIITTRHSQQICSVVRFAKSPCSPYLECSTDPPALTTKRNYNLLRERHVPGTRENEHLTSFENYLFLPAHLIPCEVTNR